MSVADHDARCSLAGFDDIGVVHKGLLPPAPAGVPDSRLHERDDQPCGCQHALVAAEAWRQEKFFREERPQIKNRSFIAATPYTKEPTKTLRGALAFGDAAQAAPSNSAVAPHDKRDVGDLTLIY
jgi:hypothetical protein